MANRKLTTGELKLANELLDSVRVRLKELAKDDSLLLFAYRRKIAKELVYDERGKPGHRGKLKQLKHGAQGGKCAHCNRDLEIRFSELDRREAVNGYTEENTELIHADCHKERQEAKGFT